MYTVCFMTEDNQKHVYTLNGRPVPFNSDKDAWDFINVIMSEEPHPKFMWIRRLEHADP